MTEAIWCRMHTLKSILVFLVFPLLSTDCGKGKKKTHDFIDWVKIFLSYDSYPLPERSKRMVE